MEIPPGALQVAGIGTLVVLALAMVWWVARVAMGWHRGQVSYWLQHDQRSDDDVDDDDNNGN